MVLFMRGKDQRIQHFATRNGSVIAKVGVDETVAVLQLRVACHYETNGLHSVEYPATHTNNSVHQFTAFAYLRLRIGRRIDRKVLYFVGTLNIGIGTNERVFNDTRVFYHGAIADHAVVTPK